MAKPNRALVAKPSPVLVASIERRIYLDQRSKGDADTDLAQLYDVPTYRLNEQVKRNLKRFPPDFMFQVSRKEMYSLTSQIAMSNAGRGGRRTLAYAFTEQGVAMLSSVLTSDRAVHVNIAIMRAFVKLREVIASHRELAQKIDDLERKFEQHDQKIQLVFDAIRELLEPQPQPGKRRIGFGA